MSLGHIDGVIFLVIFAGFIALMIKSALKASKEGNALASEEIEAAEGIQILPMWKSLLYIVGGGAAIMIGGDVVVNSASNIAAKFGMSRDCAPHVPQRARRTAAVARDESARS